MAERILCRVKCEGSMELYIASMRSHMLLELGLR